MHFLGYESDLPHVVVFEKILPNTYIVSSTRPHTVSHKAVKRNSRCTAVDELLGNMLCKTPRVVLEGHDVGSGLAASR